MRERLARFMQGRYGVDQFSNFIIIMALVSMVVGFIIRIPLVAGLTNLLSVALVIYAYFRILSKNHYKRYAENENYMKVHNSV